MTNEQLTINGTTYNVIAEEDPSKYANIMAHSPNLVRIVACQRPRGRKVAYFYGFQTKDGIRWQ